MIHFISDRVLISVGVRDAQTEMCASLRYESPEQLIQYSGHVALRAASKPANLLLSREAYIEAIEYDSRQQPSIFIPRLAPPGSQKKMHVDPELSSWQAPPSTLGLSGN